MNYSAANSALWDPIIQIAMIAVVILIGNCLRRKISFIRNSMLPVAVIGGFLLLLAKICRLVTIDNEIMEMLTFHGIAIGFIAMSLRVPERTETEKSNLVGLKSGAIIVGSYMIQGIVGLAITIGLSYTVMPELFKAAGILLPMGFGQGPGQANNIGTTYQEAGFVGGHSFGLALAAAGYLCACIVGVCYMNYLAKKGLVRKKTTEEIKGSVTIDTFESKDELPIAESLDRLSIQVAMVLVVYLVTYLLTWGITSGLSKISAGVGDAVNSLLWGFNFIIGSALAILFRVILKRLRNRKIMTSQYQNNYLLSRISGFAFDIMIVAGISSIEISDLKELWLPFVLLVIAGAVITLLHLKFVCKRVYKDYYYEGLLSMYGMMTGTISSGVLLLRELDPQMETPAANNLVLGSSFGILLGAPLLVLVGMAKKSTTMLFVTFGALVVYYFVLLGIVFIKNKHQECSNEAV